jgi:hypothetical protein
MLLVIHSNAVCVTYCDTSSVGACRHYLTMADCKKISPPFLSQLQDCVCFITILIAYFAVISLWHNLLSDIYISVVIKTWVAQWLILAHSKEGNKLFVIHSPEDGNRSSFRIFVFCSFLILDNRPNPNTQKSWSLTHDWYVTQSLHMFMVFLLISASQHFRFFKLNKPPSSWFGGRCFCSIKNYTELTWMQHTIAHMEHSDGRMPSEWMGPHM